MTKMIRESQRLSLYCVMVLLLLIAIVIGGPLLLLRGILDITALAAWAVGSIFNKISNVVLDTSLSFESLHRKFGKKMWPIYLKTMEDIKAIGDIK